MTDARVTHLWDGQRIVGRWFAQQEEYRRQVIGPIAWDIYFLYGPEADWDLIPSPLIDSGYTIIGKSRDLMKNILPFLK